MTCSRTILRSLAASLLCFSAPAAVLAQQPYERADESWISISGTVASSNADSFVLDYGDGVITVEMDDWDNWGDAYGLIDGDEVTVYGRIDDSAFEVSKIEAGSVYVDDLNTYFHAGAADEETYGGWNYLYAPVNVGEVTVRGTVQSVDEENEEFKLDTGLVEITVDTDELYYDPLDEAGYQQVASGDRISVTGEIDRSFFEGREIVADTIVTLDDGAA